MFVPIYYHTRLMINTPPLREMVNTKEICYTDSCTERRCDSRAATISRFGY